MLFLFQPIYNLHITLTNYQNVNNNIPNFHKIMNIFIQYKNINQ